MKKITTITAVLLASLTVNAQKDVKFTINHFLGANPFAFNTIMTNDVGDELKLSRFEYYISEINIVHDGGQITSASDVYVFAQANLPDTITLGNFDVTTIEAIQFAVGVDPMVNNGDPAAWASLHPLAPKNPSMHWGWASGYRFVALEGKSGANFIQDFQIHALGNKNYFKQTLKTGATAEGDALVISINADYAKSVSGMTMAPGVIEHGENNEAILCLKNFQTEVFTNTSGESSVAGISDDLKVTDAVTISPVPSNGNINISVNETSFSNAEYSIKDILGKEITKGNVASSPSISIANKGLYFITVTANGLSSTEKFIIQ